MPLHQWSQLVAALVGARGRAAVSRLPGRSTRNVERRDDPCRVRPGPGRGSLPRRRSSCQTLF